MVAFQSTWWALLLDAKCVPEATVMFSASMGIYCCANSYVCSTQDVWAVRDSHQGTWLNRHQTTALVNWELGHVYMRWTNPVKLL